MTLRECRRLARHSRLQASIVSDGCRDYVIEIRHPDGAVVLQDWRGQTKRFKSLSEAHHKLRRAGVADVALAMRIAADEACAGPALTNDGFSTLSLSH